MAQEILGQDYIKTFLTSHEPYDFAREHIIYPRRPYFRENTTEQIKTMRKSVPFSKKPIRPKRCRPSLLEYHLRESSKNMKAGFPSCRVETHISQREEIERVYGPRWILVSYADDAVVNFIQVDIDRHQPSQDVSAKKAVSSLQAAAQTHGFDIVWTTSPGYIGDDDSVVHGLYAWIKLDKHHFVMDIRSHILAFLNTIGLNDIAKNHEGAYLSQKKLVRLPGQFNVELANPTTFSKLHVHSPMEASQAFQEAWKIATPLRSEMLTSISLPSPPERSNKDSTHSSVTPPPLSPYGDTFDSLLRWGRTIVNKVYPNEDMLHECVSTLIATAESNLPSVSRTRQDTELLRQKAESIVKYLWSNTNTNWISQRTSVDEDKLQFVRHAAYIERNQNELLGAIPNRLREAGTRILDLLLKYHGRVSANSIYHGSPTPICTYRNWKLIQDKWGLITLIEYEKRNGESRGKCKMWGFKSVSSGN